MIAPVIIDLYICKIELYSLESLMCNPPDDWPDGLFDHIIEANDQFYDCLEKAEKLLGSYDEVDRQLSLLDKNTGVS